MARREPSVRTRRATALRRARAARSRAGTLRRRDDPPRRERRRASPRRGSSTGCGASQCPSSFPPIPRTRVAITTQGLSPGPGPVGRAALVPGLRGARVAGARDRDRLGRGAEGGVLVRRPVRDGAAVDGVGGHGRAGANVARRRRSRAARRRRRRRRCPADGPPAALRRRRMPPIGSRRRSVRFSADDRAEHGSAGSRAARRETWDVAVVGAGYVGVPLAQLLAGAGKSVLLVDVAEEVVAGLNRGESHIEDVPSETLAPARGRGPDRARRRTTTGSATPTRSSSRSRRRSRSSASRTSRSCRTPSPRSPTRLRPGHLVVLESTTYPGTTREVVLPAPRAERARGRQGLPPRLLARAGRPRQHEAGDRRTSRRSSAGSQRRAPSARPPSTRARSTRCTRSRRRRRPS